MRQHLINLWVGGRDVAKHLFRLSATLLFSQFDIGRLRDYGTLSGNIGHRSRQPTIVLQPINILFNQINCTTMSYVKDNLVTEGLAGKLGNRFCFRIINGKTCLYRIGLRSGEQTEAQLEVQEKFKLAAAQARADLKDATKKAEWEAAAQASAKYKTAFGAAMAHYYGTL